MSGISLPADATNDHMDAASDDPKLARAELEDLVDKFNSLLDEIGSDRLQWPITLPGVSYASATSFTTTDASDCHVGRRVHISGSSTGTISGPITGVSGSTITVDWASLSNESLSAWLGIANGGASALTWAAQLAAGVVNVQLFGAVDDDSTDNGSAIRSAAQYVAGLGGGQLYFPLTDQGVYRYTGTLYYYGDRVAFTGPSQAVQLRKTDSGTALAADPDSHTNGTYTWYSYCTFERLRLYSESADIGIDLTGFSYSKFHDFHAQLKGSSRKIIYGVGHNGSSPYYNTITDCAIFGDNDGSTSTGSVGFSFEGGDWSGGSNGPNGNLISNLRRAALLDYLFDIQVGNGNNGNNINGESIHQAYFRFNQRSADDSGTSSGSNAHNTLEDTSQSWTSNEWLNDAVKITGGTGSGQVRLLNGNDANTLNLVYPWTTIPDNTSTYEIYKGKSSYNKFSNIRGEGLAGSNPDFIQSKPGARKNQITHYAAVSLGSGSQVAENQEPTNSYFDGDLVAVTFTSSGLSSGTSAYLTPERGSAYYQGGFGFAAPFVVERAVAACEGQSTGSAQVDVEVDNDYTLTMTIDGDRRWFAFVPGNNQTVTNTVPKINCQVTTDGSWGPSTAGFAVTVFVRVLR